MFRFTAAFGRAGDRFPLKPQRNRPQHQKHANIARNRRKTPQKQRHEKRYAHAGADKQPFPNQPRKAHAMSRKTGKIKKGGMTKSAIYQRNFGTGISDNGSREQNSFHARLPQKSASIFVTCR